MATVVHPEREKKKPGSQLAAPKRKKRDPLATQWSSVSHRTAESGGGVHCSAAWWRCGKSERTTRSESHKASGKKTRRCQWDSQHSGLAGFRFIPFFSFALNRAVSALRNAIRGLVADSPEPSQKTCSSGARTWGRRPPYCGGSPMSVNAITHASRLHQNPNHG